MNSKARFPVKRVGLLTTLSVLLTMTLGTADFAPAPSMTNDRPNHQPLGLYPPMASPARRSLGNWRRSKNSTRKNSTHHTGGALGFSPPRRSGRRHTKTYQERQQPLQAMQSH